MSSRRSRLAATTNPLVLVALTWALLWGHGTSRLDAPYVDRPAASPGADAGWGDEAVWQESWSRRYPGCVALVLWPLEEEPVAVLAKGPGGLAKVSPDAALPAASEVVGACR